MGVEAMFSQMWPLEGVGQESSEREQEQECKLPGRPLPQAPFDVSDFSMMFFKCLPCKKGNVDVAQLMCQARRNV
jgi:hypothetical protein